MSAVVTPRCDMRRDCEAPVTHVGAKGYAYCDEHGPMRRGYESTRRMRKWELAHLQAGRTLMSYAPISEAEDARRREAVVVRARLEYLRGEIQAERISYGELAELQGLVEHIAPDDVELLQWAGVPEFPERPCTCEQWFHAADDDEGRDGHVHRDAGDGCTAPGCACEHNEGGL